MSTSNPADPSNSNARRRAAASVAAASIGAGILGTAPAEAAVVLVDVSGISGINAGLAPGNSTNLTITAANGNSIVLPIVNRPTNSNYDAIGFDFHGAGNSGLIAYGDYQRTGVTYPKAATPNAFSAGTVIDSSVFANSDSVFGSGPTFREYYGGTAYVSPDITNKYLAFRTNTAGTGTDPNYGWINVTWNSSTLEFQILGAAYESDAGVAIQTPSGPAPVAVPGPAPLLGLAAMVNGARAIRRRRAALLRQTAGTASS